MVVYPLTNRRIARADPPALYDKEIVMNQIKCAAEKISLRTLGLILLPILLMGAGGIYLYTRNRNKTQSVST